MPDDNDFYVERSGNVPQNNQNKIINEENYKVHAPKPILNSKLGRGGDALYMKVRASKEQLEELLDETTTIQDWVQRETSNKVALNCLNNENLKEIYYEIKDGFGEHGPILLMGFRTPGGVEIPRLKLLDKDGNVLEVLSGQAAIDELYKRAEEYRSVENSYEAVTEVIEETDEIPDYQGIIEDYQ